MVGDFYPSNWSGCVSRALYFQNIYKVRENVGTNGAVLCVDTFRKHVLTGFKPRAVEIFRLPFLCFKNMFFNPDVNCQG